MSRLGSTEIIGGISVTIGAEMDGLRAGIADAKVMAAKAEQSIGIKVPLMLADDGSRLRAQLGVVMRSIQAVASASPIRIPVILQPAGGGSGGFGGAGLIGAGESDDSPNRPRVRSAFPGEISIGSPPNGGGRLALPGTVAATAASAAGGADFGGGGPGGGAGDSSSALPGDSGGGGTGVGGGGIGWLASGRQLLRGSRFGRVLAAGLAIRESLGLAEAGGSYFASRNIGDPQLKAQYEDQYEQGLNSTSLGLRQVIRQSIPNLFGHITDQQKDQAEGNRITSEAQREDLRTDQIRQRGEARQRIISAQREAHETIGMTDSERASYEATNALSDFNVGAGKSPEDQRTRDALTQARDDAKKEDATRKREIGRASTLGLAGGAQTISGVRSEIAGHTELGTQQQVAGERLRLQGQQAGRLIGVRNPDEQKRIAAENAQELAEFDVKAAKDASERKIKIANDTDNAIGAKEQSRLRLSHRNYDADLSAFDHAAKEKLATITDLNEKQNEATRLAAQRQVIVFEQQQHAAQTIAQYQSAAGVATLQANREGFKAQLKAFDDETKQIQQNTDAKSLPAVNAARSEQRKALVKTQQQEQADINGSLATRTAQANARAGNENQTAEVIGVVGGLRQELRDAQKSDRAQVIATQTAELGALKNQILRPNQYATDFDPLRDAKGGPGGESGKDTNDLLKVIADYLKDIKNNPGGLGN